MFVMSTGARAHDHGSKEQPMNQSSSSSPPVDGFLQHGRLALLPDERDHVNPGRPGPYCILRFFFPGHGLTSLLPCPCIQGIEPCLGAFDCQELCRERTICARAKKTVSPIHEAW